MQLCFFDDTRATRLMPLTLTKPSNMVRVGILTITEKWEHYLSPDLVTRQMPEYMAGVYPAPEIDPSADCIWINGRFLPDHQVLGEILQLSTDEGLMHKHTPVAMRMDGTRSVSIFNAGSLPGAEISFSDTEHGTLLDAPWQVFAFNGEQVQADISLLKAKLRTVDEKKYPGVHFQSPYQVYVKDGAVIEPGSIIMAGDGPVYIGEKATIMSGAMLRGPVAVCSHATIKMGAKIYGDTTIGPWCKAGGELQNVVMQAYSNKGHDGFLGNSAIGEWCNLGADTNNSNLKNNYSNVRLTEWETGKDYDTGLQFCGTIMGDHSKTAINTMLNTGTVCGVCSNIVLGDFPPKHIKSFRWLTKNGEDIYKFDKAMETAGRMMERRGIEITPEYRAMMRFLFEKANR
ncbi:UDP-N-acetylglucosamine diphosphorylase/glucosamine-1-phosphate N-acetyltransferase [Cyclonatronum proteinivorum]|uniref:UDP-N-acetylglucosamine diphosphorylase/glucosamine-1-phosphate N-acetyltransferase n=1 Tax=Cyclonatronum proteinivorum TaxID=1457365 RepID=A0A345UGD2_9BACT|nr:putative sugar nucleotidyl transferase [Cyclonatronum proteinivorum]AXI99533.1 UDP-N-acetylglucosamine diphosphorylase/glucosamine-1-phosphate N-acetyltransferase [Cyclonatronum proteinivorum]